jgi:hypothetical protein
MVRSFSFGRGGRALGSGRGGKSGVGAVGVWFSRGRTSSVISGRVIEDPDELACWAHPISVERERISAPYIKTLFMADSP